MGMSPLPDYPFISHFQEVEGCRLHYIDVGAREAPVVLFLHGVPTWSYTFRKIISLVVEAGYRAVAPDLPGFGLSQKEIPMEIFSLKWLAKMMAGFLDKCRISKPVLFAHDWGGIIGMMLASEKPDIFTGLILCNSLLPPPGIKLPFLFRLWRCFARYSPVLPVATIVNVACMRVLTKTEKQGYSYPFRSGGDKKVLRMMPRLLPLKEGQPGYSEVLKAWSRLTGYKEPVLTLFSQGDPITRGGNRIIQDRIPGARNQAHKVLKGGHFVQEDVPVEIANSILAFMRLNT